MKPGYHGKAHFLMTNVFICTNVRNCFWSIWCSSPPTCSPIPCDTRRRLVLWNVHFVTALNADFLQPHAAFYCIGENHYLLVVSDCESTCAWLHLQRV